MESNISYTEILKVSSSFPAMHYNILHGPNLSVKNDCLLVRIIHGLSCSFLPSSFQGCVATSGAIAGSRAVSLQWIAYQTVSSGAYEKKVNIPMWTTGTKCVREDFPKVSIILKKININVLYTV